MKINILLKEVSAYYKKEGRSHLPWRNTTNPYRILVSELMLQQTQVVRVIPKYKLFIKRFPSWCALARAPLHEVLVAWQGLGYNRRAKFLHQTAQIITEKYKGIFPRDPAEIEQLPGIGHYTARAVAAFAFNSPEVCIETNIRTVFIYFCFSRLHKKTWFRRDKRETPPPSIFVSPEAEDFYQGVSDLEILPLVEQALKKSKMQPRDFYAALMDYGTYLKQSGVRNNSKSKHYAKQSKFEGSARQLRGAIVRELLQKPATLVQLIKKLPGRSRGDIERALARLVTEGLVRQKGRRYAIPAE